MDHILVPGLEAFESRWHFSHVVRSGGFLFLSGMTGTGADGTIAAAPAEQFEQLFEYLGAYLNAAGATFDDIVEMTSYHVDLRTHLAEFTAAKDRRITAPYPAWSAIGVSELITDGALAEVRVIARDPAAAAATGVAAMSGSTG